MDQINSEGTTAYEVNGLFLSDGGDIIFAPDPQHEQEKGRAGQRYERVSVFQDPLIVRLGEGADAPGQDKGGKQATVQIRAAARWESRTFFWYLAI